MEKIKKLSNVKSDNTNCDGNKTVQKLSYEQLESVCNQLTKQNKEMYDYISKVDADNSISKISFLLDLVKAGPEKGFSMSGVARAVSILEDILIPKDNKYKSEELDNTKNSECHDIDDDNKPF